MNGLAVWQPPTLQQACGLLRGLRFGGGWRSPRVTPDGGNQLLPGPLDQGLYVRLIAGDFHIVGRRILAQRARGLPPFQRGIFTTPKCCRSISFTCLLPPASASTVSLI